MTRHCLHRLVLASVLSVALVPVLSAQQPPEPAPRPLAARPGSVPRAAVPPRTVTVDGTRDASETRQEFQDVLRRHSPSLAAVLQLDPALLASPDYLAPYPDIVEFLERHPEIARDPAYYFDQMSIDLPGRPELRPFDPRERAMDLWGNVAAGTMVFVGFVVVVATLTWLVKTLVDYRRWVRLSRVQADAHNKVLDRLANNEELLTYVQTPAGRRFLESAPIALDPAGPTIAAPLRRILWAVEAGLVLLAGGVGLQYVSRHVPAEVAPMMLALGVLGVALGVGFVLAALVSYAISRRLGLLTAAPAPVNHADSSVS